MNKITITVCEQLGKENLQVCWLRWWRENVEDADFRDSAGITIVHRLLSWQISVLFSLLLINYESTKKSLLKSREGIFFFTFFPSLLKYLTPINFSVRISEFKSDERLKLGRMGRMGRIDIRVNFLCLELHLIPTSSDKKWPQNTQSIQCKMMQ